MTVPSASLSKMVETLSQSLAWRSNTKRNYSPRLRI